MSGPLLDVLYNTNKEEMIKNLLLESKIFGVTIFGDGATITNVPLINILAASPTNPFALLEVVDCTDQMAKGGKKDTKYLSGIVRPFVRWLKARAISNIIDLIMFDGTSYVQFAAKMWQDIIHALLCLCVMGQSMLFLSSSPTFTIRYDQFMIVCAALFSMSHIAN
jgi:hypothetical protein